MGIRTLFFTALLAVTTAVQGQVLLADSALTIPRQTWIVALPFELGVDSAETFSFESPQWTMNNRMAVQFYSGLRAGVDSLNRAGFEIQLVLAEHVEATNTYRMEVNGLLQSYTPEAFMARINRQALCQNGECKIIGPFRGDASEVLASLSQGVPVINPVSRKVDVEGKPYLIAAASMRTAEISRLAERAVAAQKMAPNSRTILLLDGSANDVAFLEAYTAVGGNTADLIIRNYQGAATLDASASVGVFTRIISLSDKVLVTARILNQLRPFEPAKTEFWTLGNVLSSSALDAQLLMRQPLVWSQVERLDYIQFRRLDALLFEAAKTTPGRWEWLGLDMAWFSAYMPDLVPNAFEGPRRMYQWKHIPGGGYYNQSALIYRYDRKNGVQAQWTPSMDYGTELDLSDDRASTDPLGSPEIAPKLLEK
ncbi:MAG: hypothetical protein ACO39W_03625 [Schleiferiaceae bacterium]